MNQKIKNAWIFTKKAGKAFLEGLGEGIDHVIEIREDARKMGYSGDRLGTDGEIVLDAKMAHEIKWMGTEQLKAIFAGRKVRLSSDPQAWREIKWMSSDQLKAIFGENGVQK